MRVLIDADIVTYRAACSAENEDLWVACARADQTVRSILEETLADSYSLFLTGQRNFRRDICPSYKANRPSERPKHWEAIREFLITHHKAQVVDGSEADDQLGIEQDKLGVNTVIASIDKDLLQIPGRHYNFVKKEYKIVAPDEGLKFLYTQALVGDRSDNIIGVVGIGPVKAARALEGLLNEQEWYDKCRELYNDDNRLHLNLKLLYIWQKPDDDWQPPGARLARPTTLPSGGTP